MKKSVLLAVSAVLLLAGSVYSYACTNLIVGKKASVDGSVICTYNCDGFGFAAYLNYSAPGRHAPGEMVAVRRGWGPNATVNYIPQAEYTYNVAGLMNENQVTIVETTWDGRKELHNKEAERAPRCATAFLLPFPWEESGVGSLSLHSHIP